MFLHINSQRNEAMVWGSCFGMKAAGLNFLEEFRAYQEKNTKERKVGYDGIVICQLVLRDNRTYYGHLYGVSGGTSGRGL